MTTSRFGSEDMSRFGRVQAVPGGSWDLESNLKLYLKLATLLVVSLTGLTWLPQLQVGLQAQLQVLIKSHAPASMER